LAISEPKIADKDQPTVGASQEGWTPNKTFQKDRPMQAQENRPELFWVDEEDPLLEIEFSICNPLVPNPINWLQPFANPKLAWGNN
jgi:hypothetical protein